MDLLELTKQFGPFVAFTVFFVWQGWKRECKLSARIDVLADQQSGMLTKLVQDTTEAVSRNTHVMESSTRIMERLEKIVEKGCMSEPHKETR